MTTLVWLLIALPAAGAAVLLLAEKRSNAWGHLLGCAAAIAAFAVGVVLFVDMLGRDAEHRMGCNSTSCRCASYCSSPVSAR